VDGIGRDLFEEIGGKNEGEDHRRERRVRPVVKAPEDDIPARVCSPHGQARGHSVRSDVTVLVLACFRSLCRDLGDPRTEGIGDRLRRISAHRDRRDQLVRGHWPGESYGHRRRMREPAVAWPGVQRPRDECGDDWRARAQEDAADAGMERQEPSIRGAPAFGEPDLHATASERFGCQIDGNGGSCFIDWKYAG